MEEKQNEPAVPSSPPSSSPDADATRPHSPMLPPFPCLTPHPCFPVFLCPSTALRASLSAPLPCPKHTHTHTPCMAQRLRPPPPPHSIRCVRLQVTLPAAPPSPLQAFLRCSSCKCISRLLSKGGVGPSGRRRNKSQCCTQIAGYCEAWVGGGRQAAAHVVGLGPHGRKPRDARGMVRNSRRKNARGACTAVGLARGGEQRSGKKREGECQRPCNVVNVRLVTC